jgi:asparagine synthase (glutamine-hydrolysing)
MCGISGIYTFNNDPFPAGKLRDMGTIMHHRGPDNFTYNIYGQVGLAHNRLSIIDLSETANQPFENENYSLAFNGEIYNFQQLKKAHLSNVSFRTNSDTEVLFELLIRYGVDKTLQLITGMFAFAFYNKQSGQLILVRDRLGIKPLFHHTHEGAIYFASEIKSIWTVCPIKTDKIKTLFSFYGSGDTNFSNTVFENVYPVKPGHYLTIQKDSHTTERCYYDVADELNEETYRYYASKKRGEIQEIFDSLLDEAVGNIMISDAPVGSFVSGGIDSGIIAALASKIQKIGLFTSNIVDYHSELPKVKVLAKHLDLELYVNDFKRADYITDLASATWHYECPIVSSVNSIAIARVAGLANDNKVKVILSGEGADEIFLGYPDFLFTKYKNLVLAPYHLMMSLYKLLPGIEKYLPLQKQFGAGELPHLLDKNFQRQYGRIDFGKKNSWLPAKERESTYTSVRMIKEHLMGLLQRNDRMGMKHSIEARFPFLHEKMVNFGINLPSHFKYRRTSKVYNIKHPFLLDKSLIRDRAKTLLPSSNVYSPKWGFAVDASHKIKVKRELFENGYLTETMRMTNAGLNFMIDNVDPYLISKLLAIEVFGRIFDQRQSTEVVNEHVRKYTSF